MESELILSRLVIEVSFRAGRAVLRRWLRWASHCRFADRSFDVVICDNVVDHAESPSRIVRELARILVPGGLLYFTVNVHHPVYAVAAGVHSSWRAVGVPYEVGPFADHTTHLTVEAAERLFDGLPLADAECEE